MIWVVQFSVVHWARELGKLHNGKFFVLGKNLGLARNRIIIAQILTEKITGKNSKIM